jgi:predicted dehydrogenase
MQNGPLSAPPRVLLTGSGSIGRRHAQNLRALAPGARLWAVCNNEASRLWAADAGVTPVASVEAGLEARPQLAVVCSVSSRHAQDLDLLMPEVEGLYLEKPVVTQRDQLDAVEARLAAGWAKPSVVGCNLRYLGAIQRLKHACAQGEAGRPAQAGLRVGQWLPDWRPGRDYRQTYSAQRALGGGVVFDLVHELDSACFLFGDIARGQAAAGRRSSLAIDTDDSAVITLLMASGLPVQISMDYVSRQAVREYLVIGDRATLHLDLIGRELAVRGPESTQLLPTQPSDWDMASTYGAAMRELLAAWAGGIPTSYSLAQAMHSTRWMIELEANAWRKPRSAA